MPQKFQITSPEGRKYIITAPDGTTREEALRRAKAHYAEQLGVPKPSKTGYNFVDGMRQFNNGLFGPVADELDGLASATSNTVNALRGRSKWEPRRAFTEGQRKSLERQEGFFRDKPVAAALSRGTGMAASVALPQAKVVGGAGLGSRVLNNAATGLAYGFGAGAAEGNSAGERIGHGIAGGTIGGLVGGAIDPLVSLSRNLWRQASPILANIRGAAASEAVGRRTANSRIGELAANSGRSTGEIADEVARRTRQGTPSMIADGDQGLRGELGAASRRHGPGQQLVKDAVRRRQEDAGTRMRGHVEQTLGPTVDPYLQVENIAADAKAAAGPAYAKAYQQPMLITPEIEAIMKTPAFRKALPEARENILNGMGDPEAMGLRTIPFEEAHKMPNVPHALTGDGFAIGFNGLSTEGFDQVIRAMGKRARDAADVNPITGKATHNTSSVHVNARADDLRNLLADQNDAYAQAYGQYGDAMSVRDAFESGRDVMNLTGHDINAQARTMKDFTNESWMAGARTSLADEATKRSAEHPFADITSVTRRGLGDETKQEAIGQMSGNSGGVRELLQRSDNEADAFRTFKSVYGGSDTASKLIDDAEAANPDSTVRALDLLFRGRPLAALGNMAYAARRASPGLTERSGHMANVLSETNPAQVAEYMDEVAKQMDKDRITNDRVKRLTGELSKQFSLQILGNSGDQYGQFSE